MAMRPLTILAWAVILLIIQDAGAAVPCKPPEDEPSSHDYECVQPPLECPNSNITYLLYTSKKPKAPQVLDEDNLDTIKYVTGAPLKVLIHGYTGNRNNGFNTAVRSAYTKRGDYNMIVVDYAPLAAAPCYDQGAANAQLIGVCLSRFLDAVNEAWGIPLENVHMIGHGLGAQVAGLCANCLRSGRLGRITGLDPALRLFTKEDPNTKLDPSDAIFVDVIHTNAGSLGQSENMGDVDFFVNGGIDQPGCERAKDPDWCSHAMSAALFAESIVSQDGFWAGSCQKPCCRKLGLHKAQDTKASVLMGEDVSVSAYGMMCVDTSCKSPYAQGRGKVRHHTLLYDIGGIVMVIICLYYSIKYLLARP